MKSEVINIKTPVSRVGNKTAILHILYALFPLHYGRFIDVFGGSGSVLLGKPTIDAFEVYNDFDRNLVNLFRCMKERTMAMIRELGFCHLNAREDFIAIRKFFDHETFDDRFLTEELMLTEILLPPPEAAELKEIRLRITEDYDVRRAAMFLKLLRNSYSSSGKSFASQPFDIRKLFGLIQELEDRMANVVIEDQDFETLIRHYDRPDAFFYADPPYFSTEDMYEVGFGWDDHVRLRETLGRIKGKFLLSYNDCPEIRELYDGFSLFDFSRTHSMAQRYPQVIDEATVERLRSRKASRNTQTNTDRQSGIYLLKVPVVCPACGKPMHRLHDARCKCTQKWVCNQCHIQIKKEDTELMEDIVGLLNGLIRDPETIRTVQPSQAEPSIEQRRLDNEIARTLEGYDFDKDALREKLYQRAAIGYQQIGNETYVEYMLKNTLEQHDILDGFDSELTNKTIKVIRLAESGSISIILINDQEIRKEQTDHASSNPNDAT